ncbi:MAG: DUF4373 domain-containing protein [Bdellovibrionaceae bacterium]|nr:DUF4373 domain-containing protein [Pseudobdellovibrionaceae bacterium]
MRWFKHFIDQSRSPAIAHIKRVLGMAGIGCYWQLIEACAEKMEKRREENYSERHCHFSFDISQLANILGCKPKRVEVILKTFQECSLLQFDRDNFVIKIDMPKLLEFLDRDTDRARPLRGRAELRDRVDKKIEKEEIEVKSNVGMPFFYREADIFLKAVKKFGSNDSENLKAYLGEDRWSWWLGIGGQRIRNTPPNEKGRSDLAYAIKNVAEAMKNII